MRSYLGRAARAIGAVFGASHSADPSAAFAALEQVLFGYVRVFQVSIFLCPFWSIFDVFWYSLDDCWFMLEDVLNIVDDCWSVFFQMVSSDFGTFFLLEIINISKFQNDLRNSQNNFKKTETSIFSEKEVNFQRFSMLRAGGDIRISSIALC